MNYTFDIDGTLADTPGSNYKKSVPDEAMIALVNELYYKGHYIRILTARGTTSGINWRPLTEQQLKEWGVKYHHLEFGLIISDKVTTPEEFLNE